MLDAGTILIVDDNPNNLQVLGAFLSHAGYKVRPALSGEVALRAVEASLPDLILLDVRMPLGIDGYETCRRLRANPRSAEVPVIFISAMADTEDKLAGFRAGGVDYVAKPFQVEEVLARVKTHIQLHRMQQHLESLVQERTRDLLTSETRYRVLFEDSPLAVMVYDVQSWCILDANVACSRFLGYAKGDLLGVSVGLAADTRRPSTTLGKMALQLLSG
jgi:DNA-binding response OmpR family regulator